MIIEDRRCLHPTEESFNAASSFIAFLFISFWVLLCFSHPLIPKESSDNLSFTFLAQVMQHELKISTNDKIILLVIPLIKLFNTIRGTTGVIHQFFAIV